MSLFGENTDQWKSEDEQYEVRSFDEIEEKLGQFMDSREEVDDDLKLLMNVKGEEILSWVLGIDEECSPEGFNENENNL